MPLQATSGAASYDAFGGGVPVIPNYIEEVFSTYLYTGNGSTQTITNGIDLSTKGGLVWIKSRQFAYNHSLTDTARGVNQGLASNTTSAQVDYSGSGGSVTAFNSTGFSLGSRTEVNDTGTNVSWTFRKQPKFFDVVTYTGTGANRTVAHSLGSVPGCIIVKRTDVAADWKVYHRSTGNGAALSLNSTAIPDNNPYWDNTTPTDTVFSLGTISSVNASGGTYVAYLFAHDAGGFGLTGTDNVISCGSFTSDSNGRADVNLGYEPQFVITKITNTTGNWETTDIMRGLVAKTGIDNTGTANVLFPNLSDAETPDADNISVTSTGFYIKGAGISNTYIYIAIRRGPMKPPTLGTTVFQPVTYTGTNVDNRLVNTGIVTDMTMARIRTATSTGGFYTADRLRANASLGTAITDAENTDADSFMTPTVGYGNSFSAMNGFGVGNDATRQLNQSSTNQLAYAFRRAPGFFDVVCYTGTGANRTVAHNLAAVPELMIVKSRTSATQSWYVYSSAIWGTSIGGTPGADGLRLNANLAATQNNTQLNNTQPTASVFSLGTVAATNENGATFVNYLFASCPGVSKVGSYTGTGATQTINCGFTGGARFVLIKRADSTGDWYVWDSARGIVSGNDPYLLLNSTAAEVTSTDYIDTASAGFEISSTAPAAINASSGTFIFLAIA